MHPNTEAAIDAIDKLRKAHPSWRDVSKHAEALPESASALAHVLRQPAATATVKAYATATEAAKGPQVQQRGLGSYAGWYWCAATIIAAVILYLDWQRGAPGAIAMKVLHLFCVFIAVYATFFLKVINPGEAWANARMTSESKRLEHFQSLLDARPPSSTKDVGQLHYKSLVLEYIRAFLVEEQRSWHARRGAEIKTSLARTAILRWLGALLLFLGVLLYCADVLKHEFVAALAPTPAKWANALPNWMNDKFGALVSVAGAALQSLAATLTGLSLAERNVRAYANIVSVLSSSLKQPLEDARAAAAGGDDIRVERFWSMVRTDLVAENRAWREALGFHNKSAFEEMMTVAKGTS